MPASWIISPAAGPTIWTPSTFRLSFETIEGRDVCRIDVAPATAPVFLAEPGGGRTADLYVRMGNATRKLLTDEALAYAQRRFA